MYLEKAFRKNARGEDLIMTLQHNEVSSDANNETTGQRTFLGDNALIQNGS